MITISLPTGTINAPPTPWKMRDNTNWPKVLDIAQKKEPRVKRTMAKINVFLLPKVSAIHPERGSKNAAVKRYTIMTD